MQLNEIQVKYKRNVGINENCISQSSHSYEYAKMLFPDGMDLREEFFCIYLNRNNRVLGHYCIGAGGISATYVDMKLIFSIALKMLASGIIMVHNHPSGNLTASESDKQMTKKIIEASKILEMSVLDHIIITSEGYMSMSDEGLM